MWIEDEPASLLAWQLGGLKRTHGFELISFSVENMQLSLGEALGVVADKEIYAASVIGSGDTTVSNHG